jgi:hypothetical protein
LAYEIPHKVPNGRRQDIKKTQNYNMAVFWSVAQFSLVRVYGYFRRNCFLHHQVSKHLSSAKLYGATPQKAAIFIHSAARI